MSSFTLKLPLPPKITNYSGHSRWRDRNRDKYYWACRAQNKDIFTEYKPEWPYMAAEFDAHFVLRDPFDWDGLAALLKWPFDFIRSIGIIADDNPKKLWPKSKITFELLKGSRRKVTRKDAYIELTLYPLDQEHAPENWLNQNEVTL